MDCFLNYLLAVIFLLVFAPQAMSAKTTFDQSFYATWGENHVSVLDQGREVQLLLDQYSGAGFSSKQNYGSGHFGVSMKIPDKNSKGVIATFYLTSKPLFADAGSTIHDEVDLEFLGNHGMPYILSTNMFVNDGGNREQQFYLWFDPTADFHFYELIWNRHQIVFFVDKVPIRVFKNNKKIGVNYPSKSMHIEATIWNSTWDGMVNWSEAPFVTHYRDFIVNGCPYQDNKPEACYSSKFYWNGEKHWNLTPRQRRNLKLVRQKYMFYDYCSDPKKNHHAECRFNHES